MYDAQEYQRKKDKKNKKKEQNVVAARQLKSILIEHKLWDCLPLICKQFIEDSTSLSKQYIGRHLLQQMFGGTTSPGAKVTLRQAIQNTSKGLVAIQEIVQQAKKDGYSIQVIEDYNNKLNTLYVITAGKE